MATEIYGASDDLIEFEGDFNGEVGFYSSGHDDKPALVMMSDGTLLSVQYNDEGVWKITLVKKGSLFVRIDQCDDPEADRHSDTAHFKAGVKWAYAAKDWEKVS